MMKTILIQVFLSLVIACIIYLVSKSILEGLIILLILSLLISIKPVFMILDRLVKRTNWYKTIVGDGYKFRKRIDFNLDLCNLGSSAGKYAFFYDGTGLKGENWALGPQTLAYDFRVLKNYSSYLKEGASVLIPLCPFSGCIIDFADDAANHKYYSFLNPVLILNYSQKTKIKIMRFVNNPFQVSPIKSFVRIFKDVHTNENNILDSEELENDANIFISSWKEQFSIINLEEPISENNKKSLLFNSNLLSEMIFFCLERNLKPVIVIPPVTKALSSKLSEPFRENYILSLVRNANFNQVPFLNYLDDNQFIENDLYFNSSFLNEKGKLLFTNRVIMDLKLIK